MTVCDRLISSTDHVPVLRYVVGDTMLENMFKLDLAFLGCEESVGYGPIEHTAYLFLDLIRQAAKSALPGAASGMIISIYIYNAKLQEYPTNWDEFSGIILPGSFSSAYEEGVPWIDKLKQMIQDVLIPRQIPTLAMCFGHQIMAHSFMPNGKAAKISHSNTDNLDTSIAAAELEIMTTTTTPPSQSSRTTTTTARAGRVCLCTNKTGRSLLGKNELNLYATHGDHVVKIPDTAVSLGGDRIVPVHAAAYFATAQQAEEARQLTDRNKQGTIAPFALTFQSHLEYGTSQDLGLQRTFEMILDQMVKRGYIMDELSNDIKQDAEENFVQVQRDSIETMVMVGRLLRWFPFAVKERNGG